MFLKGHTKYYLLSEDSSNSPGKISSSSDLPYFDDISTTVLIPWYYAIYLYICFLSYMQVPHLISTASPSTQPRAQNVIGTPTISVTSTPQGNQSHKNYTKEEKRQSKGYWGHYLSLGSLMPMNCSATKFILIYLVTFCALECYVIHSRGYTFTKGQFILVLWPALVSLLL